MARITLGELKTQVLDLADMNEAADRTDHFISPDRLRDYINLEASELYDVLVTSYQDYLIAPDHTITLVSGTDRYPVPLDFYKLSEIDYNVSGDTYYSIRRYTADDRNTYNNYTTSTSPGVEAIKYRILGRDIQFIPIPSGAGTVRLRYVPEYTRLVSDSDQVNFSFVNGWEDLIINGAAARCLIREESDARQVLGVKAQIKERIISSAQVRDAHKSAQVGDTWRRGSWRLTGAR